MVLNFDENINNDFIRDIIKALVKVLNTTFVMLFENFEFGILFVQFKRNDSANNVSEHVLKSKFVTIIIVDRGYSIRVFSLLHLEVCFLPHNSDSLVGSLDSDLFNISS
jgi:hypothetical protein